MLVPISAKHLETSYLRGRAHMFAYAGTHVIVAYAHQSDSITGIIRQAVEADAFGQLVAIYVLERHWQVFFYQLQHSAFYLPLFLSCGFMVKSEAHLALFPFYMGIERPFAAKQPYHRLVQEMLGCMGRGKFFLVMFV